MNQSEERARMRKQIEAYIPYNDYEKRDQELILSAYDDPLLFERKQPFYHISSSSWVMNKELDKILMIYHKIYKSWGWMGGHNDGDVDCYRVAKKELFEESGISQYIKSENKIHTMEILPVYPHIKKGSVVSAHLHMNITYLFLVDEELPLTMNQDETEGVSWVSVSELETVVREEEMIGIYRKCIEKAKCVER